MLEVKEYVVIVEDEQGMKLWEVAFPRLQQADSFLQRVCLKKDQFAILVERMG